LSNQKDVIVIAIFLNETHLRVRIQSASCLLRKREKNGSRVIKIGRFGKIKNPKIKFRVLLLE